MQRLLTILLALLLMSCAARRDAVQYNRLSEQFGVKLTKKDNLRLYDFCSNWIGVKYRTGGVTKQGVDCSGFVSVVYSNVYGKKLERTAANMLAKNCTPKKRRRLKEGNLVFFSTVSGRKRSPTHVGIYLKKGKFIHASTSRGVTVSDLSDSYYVRTWLTGGKVK